MGMLLHLIGYSAIGIAGGIMIVEGSLSGWFIIIGTFVLAMRDTIKELEQID
ncbi:hypothetical protein KJ885_05995 [Patescibacteria group bacterium]|nr:hypothetical protein [Patescibacteria group bacterium]